MQRDAALVLLMIGLAGSSDRQLTALSMQTQAQKANAYDLFARLDPLERARAYRLLSPEDRRGLAIVRANRWLQKYKDSLSQSDIIAIQERMEKLHLGQFAAERLGDTLTMEGIHDLQYLVIASDLDGPYLPQIEPMKIQPEQIFDEAPLPADPLEQAQRNAKNRRHDQPSLPPGFRRPLTEQSRFMYVDRISRPYFSFLSQYSYVLVGTVEKEQPYLSEDRSIVYTEFSVRAEQVTKNDPIQPLTPGEIIVIARKGGGLRLRTGQVAELIVVGDGIPPRVGARYVFFIAKENEAFVAPEAYEIRDGIVFPLYALSQSAPATEARFFTELHQALKVSR